MKCLFMGISRSSISPYVLKISRRCASLTFLVSFSMTIFALRGIAGAGEGEALSLLERALERERDRDCASSSRMGVGERPRETLRAACGEDIVGAEVWCWFITMSSVL
jgi:hypothetical protein